jgi:hypothetical protein
MCYTYYVKNVTLAIEEDLLFQARKYALERNTTVNQLVRDFLGQIVNRDNRKQAARAQMRQFMRSKRVHVGKRKWRREDLYER